MEFLVVLPARMHSTRLPGKPLKDLCGKPLIIRSYENVVNQAGHFAKVVVATDHKEIFDVCKSYGAEVVMTGEHPTGTDRVAEVANQFPQYEFIINAQPDEPLLANGVIKAIAHSIKYLSDRYSDEVIACCGMADIMDEKDVTNPSVGKVVCGANNQALYISRATIPYSNMYDTYRTQVCVYGFTRLSLKHFSELGASSLESVEGIELLRWLEAGNVLKMIEVPGERHAVDTPEDLEKVRTLFKERTCL